MAWALTNKLLIWIVKQGVTPVTGLRTRKEKLELERGWPSHGRCVGSASGLKPCTSLVMNGKDFLRRPHLGRGIMVPEAIVVFDLGGRLLIYIRTCQSVLQLLHALIRARED
jgi:hypothetical protein